jgi:Ser/Thr protein kinase RdoA (MazF antagonist)
MDKQIVEKVLSAYPDFDNRVSFARFGSGHIHSTYKIQVGSEAFILQEFNDGVFRFPDRIAANLTILYEFLQDGMLGFALPLPLMNQHGEMFTREQGRLFRIFPFIPGVTKDKVDDIPACGLAAQAFADFVAAFLSVDASQMQETIPNFHDLALRFEQFDASIRSTQIEMNAEVESLIGFYQDQRDLLEKFNLYRNRLPIRVTHNDTKINNLIYEEDLSKVNALIDLDTIMGGFVFYDFGDLVRTVTCTEDEASRNWEAICVDLRKYEALIDGFFKPLKGRLLDEELASLTYGGEMMTCIMGLRFLTDYLNGNVYYHISYQEQNLHRSKNQRMLLHSLRDNRIQIQKMVDRAMMG